MNAISRYLKDKEKTVVWFAAQMKMSRASAHRILSGARLRAIRKLFMRLYEVTRLTPNEILDIPPSKGANNGNV